MPRTYHAGAAGGVQPLAARQPGLAVFGKASSSAHCVTSVAGIVHRGVPSHHLASQLSSTQLSLLALLCPAPDFTLPVRIDWPAVTDLAARQGCLPRLAALHLAELSGVVPEEVVARWSESRQYTAARNLLLAHEEGELLAEYTAAGVLAMPLKGVSLARILHNDAAARSSIDIDLAIHPSHIAQAADILRARGYRVSLPSQLLQRAAFLRSVGEKNAEVTAAREQAGMELMVELHWKILPLPDDEIWNPLYRYEPASVPTLAPELYFLFLCEHLAGHGWGGVRWLCDVADFLLRFAGRMDVPRILRLARDAGLRRRVGITLELLDVYFGVTWTPLDSLRDSRARHAAAHFLMRPLESDGPHGLVAHHREQLSLQDGPAWRLKYLWMLAHPTHVEWLRKSENGRVQVRGGVAAWAVRLARLAGLGARSRDASSQPDSKEAR